MRNANLLLPLAVSFATGLSAQKVNEVEPNDTAATAQPIATGQHVVASYSVVTDEDWFSFTLAAPGQVHLHTVGTGTLSLAVTRDNRIAIYDATGTTRMAWNDGSVGTMADCGVTLPAGSYTALVGLKSGAAGAYDLDFYVLPVNPIDTFEAAEPNDATGIPSVFTPGDTIEGYILPTTPADVDFWQFNLGYRCIVLAAMYDDGSVPQLDNAALRFYEGGIMWTAMGVGDATNSASHRVTTLTHPGVLNAGTYAIAVKGGTAAAGTPPWNYTQTGIYSLRTALIALPDTVVFPEQAEPNNNVTTPAGYLAFGHAASGNSTGSLDQDWYQIVVAGPTTIGAMAEGTGATPLAGSSLTLKDSTGLITLATGSGNATTHGRVVYTIEAAGTYYLQITGPTVAVTGDYLLHFGGCDPLYVSATTRTEPASTNACIGSTGLRPLMGFMQGETPAFGSTFVTRIERTIPTSFAIAMVGLSNTFAFGTVPLPFLIGYGGLDSSSNPTPCLARVDPLLMNLVLTDAAGSAEYTARFAYNPAFIGVKVFQQALCFDPVLNAFGFSVSNDTNYVLGDRPF